MNKLSAKPKWWLEEKLKRAQALPPSPETNKVVKQCKDALENHIEPFEVGRDVFLTWGKPRQQDYLKKLDKLISFCEGGQREALFKVYKANLEYGD